MRSASRNRCPDRSRTDSPPAHDVSSSHCHVTSSAGCPRRGTPSRSACTRSTRRRRLRAVEAAGRNADAEVAGAAHPRAQSRRRALLDCAAIGDQFLERPASSNLRRVKVTPESSGAPAESTPASSSPSTSTPSSDGLGVAAVPPSVGEVERTDEVPRHARPRPRHRRPPHPAQKSLPPDSTKARTRGVDERLPGPSAGKEKTRQTRGQTPRPAPRQRHRRPRPVEAPLTWAVPTPTVAHSRAPSRCALLIYRTRTGPPGEHQIVEAGSVQRLASTPASPGRRVRSRQ